MFVFPLVSHKSRCGVILIFVIGTPWDQDKTMLDKWGLSGMKPFDQVSVKRKERFPVEEMLSPAPSTSPARATASSQES